MSAFRYPPEAKRLAWRLYSGHRTYGQIVQLIKKDWPRFTESTLKGWINRYGWSDRRAKLDRAALVTESKAEEVRATLLDDLDVVRQALSDELQAAKNSKKAINPQTAYAYARVCKQMEEAVQRHEQQFDYLGKWTRFFSDLVGFLMPRDEGLARSLDAHLDDFQDHVLEAYGA